MDALHYKIQNDKYYRDVKIDMESVDALPLRSMDVSNMIQFIDCDIGDVNNNDDNFERLNTDFLHSHPSSFFARQGNAHREVEKIISFLENVDSTPIQPVDWPTIASAPVNEYNTKGLFDMAFPTLFSTGDAKWFQPWIYNVRLHEYGLHLLRYSDNRFGSHP